MSDFGAVLKSDIANPTSDTPQYLGKINNFLNIKIIERNYNRNRQYAAHKIGQKCELF